MISKVSASMLRPPPSHRVWVRLPALVFVASPFRICPCCLLVMPLVWEFTCGAVVSRRYPISMRAAIPVHVKLSQCFGLRVYFWRFTVPPLLVTRRFVDLGR